jgi:hypothetical protein
VTTTDIAPSTNGAVSKAVAEVVKISPVNFQTIAVTIVGTAPLLQCAFSAKARSKMAQAQSAGQQARSKKVREARDFESDYQAAFHRDEHGRAGHPAAAFRNAAISACRLVGFQMTKAKLSIFVEHDSLDAVDGTPLVWVQGTPERSEMMGRNATGVADIRIRPLWREWRIDLRVRFDADQFSTSDVLNLLDRAGQQVGIGEGRPDSRESNGMGFGVFQVARS